MLAVIILLLHFLVYSDTIFLAALSNTTIRERVIFDRDVINPGGYYNNQTGYYTVPYDGIYQFHAQVQASSSTVLIELRVDGGAVGSHADGPFHDGYRSATVLLQLEAGQEVNVFQKGGAFGYPIYLTTYFHGYMVSTD